MAHLRLSQVDRPPTISAAKYCLTIVLNPFQVSTIATFNLATSNNLVSSPDNRISKFGFRRLQGPLMSPHSAPTPISKCPLQMLMRDHTHNLGSGKVGLPVCPEFKEGQGDPT